MAEKAFSFQIISQEYKKVFDGEKKTIEKYLETTDEIDVDMGKGIKTAYGTIIYKSRDNWSVNKDELENLIKSGKINLRSLLEISSVNAAKLKDLVGSTVFEKIAENAPSEHLALTATPAFKEEVRGRFSIQPGETAPKRKPKTNVDDSVKAVLEADKPAKKTRAKSKKTRSKSKKTSPKDDLKEILGEM